MGKILVVDNFVANPDEVRNSALITGFGTWKPCNTVIGYDNYDGVNINGMHSPLVRALTNAMGCSVFPASMIFRVTGEKSEPARIHSDRMFADYSCIVYLSIEPKGPSGTGFYQHRPTGNFEMPPLETFVNTEAGEIHKREMTEGSNDVWKKVHYVEGKYNRALIFKAPLYHARVPRVCTGTTPEDSRMVWVCHYNIGSFASVV
jgi:Family of unknown function (DUF6445)